MGLSLLEFEAHVKQLLDDRVSKTYEDYESPITQLAGAAQNTGDTFRILVRINSKTNNLEVYHKAAVDRTDAHKRASNEIGGYPLLGLPSGVLTDNLATPTESADDVKEALGKTTFAAGGLMENSSTEAVLHMGTKIVPLANDALGIKNRIWADHEADLMKDLPELTLRPTDIQLIARYVTARSNMPAFSKMYAELGSVAETHEAGTTLYIQKVSLTGRILRYNPAFIAKAIVQDMLTKHVGTPSMQRYSGALASVAYMIGHELLHVIYNHFDPEVNQGLKDMQLPPLLNKSNSKSLKRVMGNTVPIEELMNNRFMSEMFDMPAVNGGYTVPDFRSKQDMDRGRPLYTRMTGGRWYLGDAATFGNMHPSRARSAQQLLSEADYLTDESTEELINGASKLEYDRWYPAIYYVPPSTNLAIVGKYSTMPQESTFFADGTLPLPSFWDLELLMRRGFAATRTDEELVKVKPSYGAARKPEVTGHDQPDGDDAEDDANAGADAQDSGAQDAGAQDDGAQNDAGDDAAEPTPPPKVTPAMQTGDVALEKATGVYRIVIGVVSDGEPQELLTFPVTKLNTSLTDKIMSAVQGHKTSGVMDQDHLDQAAAIAAGGGSPHAPVRLGADTMASVMAGMAADVTRGKPTPSPQKGDELRPVYMDVRDSVDASQSGDDGQDDGNEPQPDVEINNQPEMPPEEPEASTGGGSGQDDGSDDGSNDADADGTVDGDDDDASSDGGDDSGDGAGSGSSTGDTEDGSAAGDGTGDAANDSGDASDSDGEGGDGEEAGGTPSSDDKSSGSGGKSDGGSSSDMQSRMDNLANQGDGSSSGASAEQEWDDYLNSLGGNDSSTLGDHSQEITNDDSTDSNAGSGAGDDADKDDDDAEKSGGGSGQDDDETSGSGGASKDGSDDNGGDKGGDKGDDGTAPDVDPDSLFDRSPDSEEARAERKRRQDKLKEQLDKLNQQMREAASTMDSNRSERERNNGQLTQETMSSQAAGDGAGIGFGGGARSDAQTQGLLSMIRKWARKIKGVKVTTDVGYNASKLSRRIKGAWGADDDMPVKRGSDDKALVVIFDASGSLSDYAKLISKTIAATVNELDKKMGVKYVIPINFDGARYPTGIYSVKELDKELPRFLKTSHSLMHSSYKYLTDLFEGTAEFQKTKYRGDPTKIAVGGVIVMSDFDLQEFWATRRGNHANASHAVIPDRLVKAMRFRGNKLPWLNICWLTQGPETVKYLYRYHALNAEQHERRIAFDGMVVNKDGTGGPVKFPKA